MDQLSGLIAWAVFGVFGAIAVAGALAMTLTMSMYRAGLALIVSFLALAVLFFQLGADLPGVVQIMMNVAGMSVMILFMVMLMMDPGGEMMWEMARQMRLPGIGALKMGWAEMAHRKMPDMAMQTRVVPLAAALATIVAALLLVVVLRPVWPVTAERPGTDDVAIVGVLLLSKYMIAFEGAALLILAGIVSAVLLGRREREGVTEMAQAQYTCPMHPEVVRDKPGKCPKCGMALVPKKEEKRSP